MTYPPPGPDGRPGPQQPPRPPGPGYGQPPAPGGPPPAPGGAPYFPGQAYPGQQLPGQPYPGQPHPAGPFGNVPPGRPPGGYPPGYPPAGPGGRPPNRGGGSGLLIGSIAAFVVVVLAAVVAILLSNGGGSGDRAIADGSTTPGAPQVDTDQAAITASMTRFIDAVNAGDTSGIRQAVCSDLRSRVVASADPNGETLVLNDVTNVTVTGDTATSDVTVSLEENGAEVETSSSTETFHREGGTWYFCPDLDAPPGGDGGSRPDTWQI